MNKEFIKAAITTQYGSVSKFLKEVDMSQHDFYLIIDPERIKNLLNIIKSNCPEAVKFMGEMEK